MAKRSAVKITTNCAANHYTGSNERIVEYSSPHGGGLIAFRSDEESGVLRVDLYRHDPTVKILVGPPYTSEVQECAKRLLARLDEITTADFQCGGERDEREALRRAIEAAECSH
ncbi:MAG TPA: hypothetical protein PLE61_15475 [Vicinamibacterales bacterium]|nr:hypothetical protein [Vicinamibacterales bacterium]